MQQKENKCGICDHTEESPLIPINEMMFGKREVFNYFLCPNCGCLQIANKPQNIAAYYPENYYSFAQGSFIKKGHISKYLAYCRTRYQIFGHNLLGYILNKIHQNPVIEIIGKTGITIDSKVLDLGCGSGQILYTLSLAGMKNLLGVDPYLNQNIEYENGLRILKNELKDVNNGWDLIMMHHVLEHLENQQEIMHLIYDKLQPDGRCLIRIPVCDGEAWSIFKENWVQADAPRHYFLHSIKSIEFLANKTGFTIEKKIYDSSAFQFWGSIQYTKNIPLMSDKSYLMNPKNSIFTKKEIAEFKKKSIELNNQSKGDQVCVILKKIK